MDKIIIVINGGNNMPKLKCDVTKCHYNCQSLCSRKAISVDGPHSYSKSETLCRSYVPKNYSNFFLEIGDFEEHPKSETNVYCDAENCVFQKESICHADKIEIKETKDRLGSKAHHESMCKTFECIDK